MSEVRWINNLMGTLYYFNTPIIEFKIEDRKLIYANDLSNGKYYPHELVMYGVSYGSFNEFFERRTMKENCMYYREHLHNIGMDQFNFDEYIKKNNGNNNLDNFWVMFEDFGARCFEELMI